MWQALAKIKSSKSDEKSISWSIFSVAVILGLTSVVSALVIGFISYHYAVEDTLSYYQQFYLGQAKMLAGEASQHKDESDEDLLKDIQTYWQAFENRATDEYVCIVDNQASLILHTKHPEAIGKYVGRNKILGNESYGRCSLHDLVKSKQDYIGGYISSKGQQQIVAFVYIPERQWVLGIHRSKAALEQEIRSNTRNLTIGFIIGCGVLMPVSLMLLSLRFYKFQQKRKDAEDKVYQKQKELEAIFDAAPVGMLLFDENLNVKRSNAIISQMVCKEHSELVTQRGGAAIGCIHSTHDSRGYGHSQSCKTCQFCIALLKVLEDGESVHGVEIQPTLNINDTLVKPWLQISAEPVNISGQKHALITINDITDRKQVEDRIKKSKSEVEKANKELEVYVERTELLAREAIKADLAKSEFIAKVSHETRTPMNGIIGMLDLALDEPLSETLRDYLDTAKSSADILLNLIDDILDISKVEAGKIDVRKANCSLQKILRDIDSLNRYKADEKGLEFRIIFDTAVPVEIHTDSMRLRQCLLNLVGNAVKFTDSGFVHLHVLSQEEEKGHAIRFDIKDTGIGIAENKCETIFEPFNQVDNSATRRFGGAGLGLTITRQLVKLLGGTVSVESEPGEGSTFTLIIPNELDCSSQLLTTEFNIEKEDRSGKLKSSQPRYTGKILVVEDDAINQKTIQTVLGKCGLEVQIAADGEEGVKLGSTGQFDLIFMDISMPVMNGLKATNLLRNMGLTTPIIALTANVMKGDREKCIAAGCNAFLGKPINREELFGLLDTYLSSCVDSQAEVTNAKE